MNRKQQHLGKKQNTFFRLSAVMALGKPFGEIILANNIINLCGVIKNYCTLLVSDRIHSLLNNE